LKVKKFRFSEEDIVGEETLEALGQADRFNQWMYKTIKPWCKGDVMEIGSGAGNISQYFLKDGYKILLTDIREHYCNKLRTKFETNPNLLGIEKVNLINPQFEETYGQLLNSFDTVFALNVIEHIEDDFNAIANCKKFLKPGGHLIILVPSFGFLYNNFDKGLGHYRRYNIRSLKELFVRNNFSILHQQYFNFAGMFGWFISGSVMRKKVIPSSQLKIYNLLVPVFKYTDILIFNSTGLSTIVVGKKK
jgi:SAM-dependent methyltransferase